MLQQTQVDRVVDRYREFVHAFPDFESLKAASLAEVYSRWQGLGYNRRALALKRIAEAVVSEHNGRLPDNVEKLRMLPGIGAATASSICAFAFNQSTIFIETNIRTVFIHHFFRRRRSVDDAEIAALVEMAVDADAPCRWYSALMDYGTMLKKRHPGLTRKSAQYRKQGRFEGSRRQIRGRILRRLLDHPRSTAASLARAIGVEKRDALPAILAELVRDGLIHNEDGKYSLAR